MKNKKRALTLMFTGIMGATMLSGCAKTANCDINQKHAHEYIAPGGYVSYIDSEKESVKRKNRTLDYILVSEEESELRDFENKKGLYRISENKDIIESGNKNKEEYIEYEYAYTGYTAVPTGKTVICVPTTRHSWTKDKNHDRLTGLERLCKTGYYAYKIEENEEGKKIILQSDYYYDFNDIPEEYKYIKEDFYEVIIIDKGYELESKYIDEEESLEKDNAIVKKEN